MDDNPRAIVGGNFPPVSLDVLTADLLAEENKDLLAEWSALTKRATWLTIDPVTLQEVWTAMTEADLPIAVDITADARDFWNKVELRRTTRKQPYDAATTAIQGFFLPQLLNPITTFGKSLTARLNTERKRLEAEAAKRRQEIEEEARRHTQTATLIDANKDRAPIVRGIDAETVARRETVRAGELTTQASLTTAAPITSNTGAKLATTTVKVGVIVDLGKALAWAKTNAEEEIRAAVQAVVDRSVRAKLTNIPGVRIDEEEQARVTRRGGRQ